METLLQNEYVEFNYDESKAGALGVDYTLEDPLVFADGRRIKDASEWQGRRKELLGLFEREEYGRMPHRSAISPMERLLSSSRIRTRSSFVRRMMSRTKLKNMSSCDEIARQFRIDRSFAMAKKYLYS